VGVVGDGDGDGDDLFYRHNRTSIATTRPSTSSATRYALQARPARSAMLRGTAISKLTVSVRNRFAYCSGDRYEL
jgi:hypothetical protein